MAKTNQALGVDRLNELAKHFLQIHKTINIPEPETEEKQCKQGKY